MKKTIVCLCGAFSITTAGADVYEGIYTNRINIERDSLIEQNTIFDGAQIGATATISVASDVVFKNISSYGAYAINSGSNYLAVPYVLNINGDNVCFMDNGGAISGSTVDINIYGNSSKFLRNKGRAISNYSNYKFRLNIFGTGTLFQDNAGGAISIDGSQTIINIEGQGTKFINNSATNGGAIINKSGDIKLNAAVEFVSNSATLGGAIYNTYDKGTYYYTPNVDAYAFIGAGSMFRGNTASKNGGAIYNDGKKATIDIDTGTTGVYFETANDSIYNNGGVINFLGSGTIAAGLTSLTSVRGDGSPVINLGRTTSVFDTVNLQDNTTLKTTVWRDGDSVRVGNLAANKFNIQNNDELTLKITVDNRQVLSINGAELAVLIDRAGTQDAGWDFFGNPDKHPKFRLENNLVYDIEFVRDGVYKITPKAFMNVDPSDESDVVSNAAMAWNMTGFAADSVAESIANEIHRLSQFVDTRPEYENALALVAPETTGVAENIINRTTNTNMRRINQRLISSKPGFWTTGGYSVLAYGDYSGNTIGATIGQDVSLSNSLKLGMAFSYANSHMDNNARKFNIDSPFDMSLYARWEIPTEQYDIYANVIFAHGAYNITENKKLLGYDIESEFDAMQTSAQVTLGFTHSWWGLDAGVRHNNLNLGSYTDSIGQHVAGTALNATYSIAELNVGDTINRLQWAAHIGNEFVIAGDDTYTNIVTAPNSQRYYHTTTYHNDNAIIFGTNMNFAITAATSVGLAYYGIITSNYSEHMGQLHFNWTL